MSNSSDQILKHLDRYGIRDKDAIASLESRKNRRTTTSTVIRKRGVLRRSIDLHGKTIEPALVALRMAIDECIERGIAELLVIHGYGRHAKTEVRGTLKTAVLQYLDERMELEIKSVDPALSRDGGEGATLVRF